LLCFVVSVKNENHDTCVFLFKLIPEILDIDKFFQTQIKDGSTIVFHEKLAFYVST